MVKRSRSQRQPSTPNVASTGLFADLVRILRIWPWEIAEMREQDPGRLLEIVDAALARARQDGLAGHWAYDLNRHLQLVDLRRRLAIAARGRAQSDRTDM